VSVVRFERDACVCPRFGPAFYERRLVPSVRHYERHRGADDILAKRCIEWLPPKGWGAVSRCYALEVLALGVDKRDENRGDVEKLCRETRERVQTVLGARLEKS
jgi:hypothetical protein